MNFTPVTASKATCALLCRGFLFGISTWAMLAQAATPANPHVAVERYSLRPIAFEPNLGQTDSRVEFLTRGHGYAVFLTRDELVLSLHTLERQPSQRLHRHPKFGGEAALRVRFQGANPNVEVI